MAYSRTLTLLADPTRRAIAERLLGGPRPVNDIAAGIAVSRPAVSQHLKALETAGVVAARREGTRRFYALRPEALGELRAYVDAMWRQALASFGEHVREPEEAIMNEDVAELPVPPVVVEVRVACGPAEAFRRFTLDMGRWWPIGTHAVGKAIACAMEPFVGGRVYETTGDGETSLWGRIAIWEPNRRVAFTWHPGRAPSAEQTVEVTFRPEGEGCTVRLEHRGWAAGTGAKRDTYDEGWRQVLGEHFARYRP
jgi:DNA-binding transcriptional ArsR family regulator